MEDPRKHEEKKKKNSKTMPAAINIGAGAGSFGMGGIVLFGGALVTAALVSALLIKTRRQRRSSSDTIKKSRSPSPETQTQTVDAPNQLELMMKSNKDRESSKDFSVDSSPLDLQNLSDGVTSMKEMQTKPNQNLTPDENQNSGMDNDEKMDSGDGNEDIIFSVVREDQESISIYVDSVFESEELDNGYEKIALDCEKQVVVAAQTELGFPSSEEDSCSEISVISAPRDDGGEEQKYSMLIDNENDEQTDAGTEKSLVSNEAVTSSIEEYEAIEGVSEEDQVAVEMEESMQYEKARDITVEASQGQVPFGNNVAELAEEDEEIPTGHAGEDQETVFVNEEAAMEAACVNQVKVEDNPQVQFLEEEKEKDGHDEMIPENCEGDLINETGYVDRIVSELVMVEEAIDAACVQQIEVEDGPKVQFLEEEKEKDCHDEIIQENCEGDLSNKTGTANQIMREEKQQMQEEEASKAACLDSVNMKDILEMADHEVALDAQEMHVNEVRETFSSGEHPSSAVACIMNLNDSLKVAVDDQTAVKENNPPRQLMNEEEKGKETTQKVEEQVTTEDELVNKEEKDKEGEIPHVQYIEAAKVDNQTAVREDNPPRQLMNKEEKGEETAVNVQVEMVTKDELVKKEGKSKEDEIRHVHSIEEDEEAKDDEEDVTVKTEVSSDGTGDSSIESNGVVIWPDESRQEELTPEAKIGKQKIEENMEEDQTILGKEQNDSDHNGTMKEDKGSKSASSYRERFVMELAKGRKQAPASEPWNLKLRTWSVLVSIWCLCHWYSELPFPELSLVGCLLFILILFGYRNRTTYLVKSE